MTDRPVGFGRRADGRDGRGQRADPARTIARRRDRPRAAAGAADSAATRATFGKLLVIAGSLDYAGAALLVCRAAGRAGAGLVTLAVPESLQPLFAAKVVEATTMALPEDDVEEVEPEPMRSRGSSTTSTTRSCSGPGSGPVSPRPS